MVRSSACLALAFSSVVVVFPAGCTAATFAEAPKKRVRRRVSGLLQAAVVAICLLLSSCGGGAGGGGGEDPSSSTDAVSSTNNQVVATTGTTAGGTTSVSAATTSAPSGGSSSTATAPATAAVATTSGSTATTSASGGSSSATAAPATTTGGTTSSSTATPSGTTAVSTSAASAPSSMLFWSSYESSIALATPTKCYSNGCWQYATGTDATTGTNMASNLWGNPPAFQMIENSGVSATPSNIGDYITNQIVSITGHKSTQTQALVQTIHHSGCNAGSFSCGTGNQGWGTTQDPLMFLSNTDIPEAYISKWMILQPDLMTTVMSSPTWVDLFEWKTPDPIDYRFQIAIENYAGGAPHWMAIGDAYYPSQTEFWRVYADNVPVPLGQWFKLEIYWKRAPDNSGRFWAAVNGQVILDHSGPNYGARADHIDRVMAHQVYTGGSYPLTTTIDDLQIWNTWPTAAPGNAWYDPPYGSH